MKLKAMFLGLVFSSSAFAGGGFGGAYVGFSAKTEAVSNSANQSAASSVCLSPYNWIGRIKSNGGTVSSESVAIARNLVSALSNKTYLRSVVFFYPLLDNLTAARCPLLYNGGGGTPIAGNNGFVSGDFTQSGGLQGNGVNKSLNTGVFPSQLGTSSNGGMFYGENNISFSVIDGPMGCYSNDGTQRFSIDLRVADCYFFWGLGTGRVNSGAAATNGRYYTQRSSITSREMWKDGLSVATNTVSASASLSGDRTIYILAQNGGSSWPGRATFAGMFDGAMTSANIADFDALIVNLLLTPTGR